MNSRTKRGNMKAKISELWDTGIDIIDIDDEPLCEIDDLKQAENIKITGKRSIQLDGIDYDVNFRNVSHPSGAGKCWICEVY